MTTKGLTVSTYRSATYKGQPTQATENFDRFVLRVERVAV